MKKKREIKFYFGGDVATRARRANAPGFKGAGAKSVQAVVIARPKF
jgi:hypothetical protein